MSDKKKEKRKDKQKHFVRITEVGQMYVLHADDSTKRSMPDQIQILNALKDREWNATLTFGEKFKFTKDRLRKLLINLMNMKLIEFK